MQVAHSKKYARDEVESAIEFLLSKYDNDFDEIIYTNSAFYKKMCPYVKGEEYRKCLYSKIGYEYKHFRFCFLDVDKYLGIEKTKIRIQILKELHLFVEISMEKQKLLFKHLRYIGDCILVE